MNSIAIIPAFNEEKRIGEIIRKAKKYVDKVIVVDDGSTDRTAEISKRMNVETISYKENKGKGFALRSGFRRVLELKPKYIITLDSDGQHNPNYIPEFLEDLKKYDIVIGTRFKGKIRTSKTNIIGNIGLKFGVNLLSFGFNFEKWLTDTESGYRGYRYDSLKRLNLKAKKFDIEGEIILEAARKRLKIIEIPIVVPLKIKGVTVLDGLRNGLYVLKKFLLD